MRPKHKALKCNANYICERCNGRHHIIICQKGNLKSTGGNNLGAGNNSTNVQATLPPIQKSFASNRQFGSVNLDNRNNKKCNISFDSVRQRKYITKSLKDKLNLLPFWHERITLTNQGSNSVLLSKYLHLGNIGLAQNLMGSLLNINVLTGLDNYYNSIYGTVIRGKSNDLLR